MGGADERQDAGQNQDAGANRDAGKERAAKSKRGPGGGGGMLSRLDKDGDGKVSKEEVGGMFPAEAFDRMDRNGDGMLEASEIPTPGGGGPRGGKRPPAEKSGDE